MSERGRLAGLVTVVLRAATGLVAVGALVVATFAWIDLSQPFDPPRLDPVRAPAAATVAAAAYPGAITVLTYHDVADEGSSDKTLTRRAFAEHMATLAALGYQTVSLATVRDLVRHKPVRLPERPLLLTFDDGSLTTWTTIDPVLEQYRFTAVAFLTSDLLVEPGTPSYFLSTRHVRRLQESGRWEFGSHTAAMDRLVPVPGDIKAPLTNRITTDRGDEDVAQWRTRVAADLDRSRERLAELTGAPPFALSYPYGDGGNGSNVPHIRTELPALLERSGFEIAFVGENVPTGHIDAVTESSPRWLLPRIGVRGTTSVADLMRIIGEATPTPMPPGLTDLSWTGDRAECTVTRAAVRVRATGGQYATCSVRDVNTSRWLDYSLTTRVGGISPTSSAVVGLRDGVGSGHYGRVEVLIGMTRLAIRQRVGSGPLENLLTTALPARGRTTLTIGVRKNVVSVGVNGRPAVTAEFDRRLHEGGVTLARAGAGSGAVTFHDPLLTNHSAP